MSKYSETLMLYPAALLGLNPDIVLKEIDFLGYQDSEKTNVSYTLWLANTTESTDAYLKTLVIADPSSSSKTIVDTSKLTKFAEVFYPTYPAAGSKTQEAEIIKFESENGFTYSGGNLVLFVELNGGKTSDDKPTAPYNSFFTCNNGMTGKLIGGYRDSGYDTQSYGGGYGVNTKKFNWNSDNNVKAPVLKIGYQGAKVQVTANVTGRIVSDRSQAGIAGATVTLNDLSATTAESGIFTITVEDVDQSATYTLTASAEGFETSSRVVDIKAGGDIALGEITLTKLPVPAVLSGKVIDSATNAAVSGATITYESMTALSADDGSYSFNIANIDDLPWGGSEMTATAKGYLDFATSLTVNGDMTYDIRLEPLPALPGEGVQIGEWDPKNYGYDTPFNPLWKYSAGQAIYTPEMFAGVEQGTKFSSVSFYGYYTEPTTPGTGGDEGDEGDDYEYGYEAPAKAPAETDRTFTLKAYLIDTELTGFDASDPQAISTEGLTPNFEGEVTVSVGGDKNHPAGMFTIDLTTPYTYGGKGMALLVTSDAAQTGLFYFCSIPGSDKQGIGCYGSTLETAQKWTLSKAGIPVIKLGDFVPTADLSGSVTDAHTGAALENVAVTLSAGEESYTAASDAEGKYTFSIRNITLGTPYRLNFSLDNYYDETKSVTFTEETLTQTVDASLEMIPVAQLTGVVTDAATEAPLADVTVTLAGNGESYPATTDAEGKYTFTVSEIALETPYTLSFSLDGYVDASKEVTFTYETLEQTVNASLEQVVAIDAIGADADRAARVYSVTGVLMMENASGADLRKLPAGIYICNGRKIVIK